jgi:hypothetical protein
MTQKRGKKMVEPSGIEPLTSTMPLSFAPDFPPFLARHFENAPRTNRKLEQFSVPLGPKTIGPKRGCNLIPALSKNAKELRYAY